MGYVETDYLVHHGILGMKWGVRRYQNKDGTLTAAGKKRRNGFVDTDELNPKFKRRDQLDDELIKRTFPKRQSVIDKYKNRNTKSLAGGANPYLNKDGTLTEKGKKRYERDIRENKAKKKENRIDTSEPDPKRWMEEDLKRTKQVTDSASDLVKKASDIEKATSPKASRKRMDLSKMSDQELRSRINRELLEQQYNNLFSQVEEPTISKGRQYARNALDIASSVLTVTSSALGIAIAIKTLSSN